MAVPFVGYAVIIVNKEALQENPNDMFKTRKNCENDLDYLRSLVNVFGLTWLNGDAGEPVHGAQPGRRDRFHFNLSREQWKHSIVKPGETCACITCKVKSLPKDETGEVFLFAISSHGGVEYNEECVLFSDCQRVFVQDIIDAFSDQQCPALVGKQRILMFQNCRSHGDKALFNDDGSLVDVVMSSEPNEASSERPTSSSTQRSRERDKMRAKPLVLPPDFLVVFPTTAGRKSKRNDMGSWLMHALNEVSNQQKDDKVSILKMLTDVSRNISFKSTKQEFRKSAVEILHTLEKPLVLKKLY